MHGENGRPNSPPLKSEGMFGHINKEPSSAKLPACHRRCVASGWRARQMWRPRRLDDSQATRAVRSVRGRIDVFCGRHLGLSRNRGTRK